MRTQVGWAMVVGMIGMGAGAGLAEAAKVVVDLGKAEVRAVGAIARWDQDGNFRRPVDPKAKIDAPQADYWAEQTSPGRWEFKDLPKGRYDLVILGKDRVRIEGFEFAPVLESVHPRHRYLSRRGCRGPRLDFRSHP